MASRSTPSRQSRRAQQRKGTGGGSSPRSLPMVLGAVVVIGVALAVALLGGDPPAPEGIDPVVAGEALAPDLAGGPAPAPVITATELTSGGEATAPVEGSPTIVLFAAHWCPACDAEVPVVQQWLDDGRLPEGVELQLVATANDPLRNNFPAQGWLERHGWTSDALLDVDSVLAGAYGITSFPSFVAVDADGTAVDHVSGQIGPDQLDALAASIAPEG